MVHLKSSLVFKAIGIATIIKIVKIKYPILPEIIKYMKVIILEHTKDIKNRYDTILRI